MATARGTSGSYYEDYMRSNAMLKHGSDRNTKQLLTDRNAYISFLEVQLERVSAACLSAQTVEKRLAELESTQLTNDQKLSSLSKVLRLNQDYVEQSTEQSRSELAAFASKMDSWMEKYSTELQSHETRLTELEEHLRRTDAFVETLSCDVRQALDSVKVTTESELQDIKTLVYAAETRLESIQTAQCDTEQHMELLQQLVTDRVEADLERIRTSLSEKYIAIEEKHDELQGTIKLFATEIEAGWKADLARSMRAEEEKYQRVRDHVERLDQTMIVEIHDVKEFLRKCLDAQHLLSATVVGLQTEVDDRKYLVRPAKNLESLDTVMDDIHELRTNQLKLKEALRVIQSCSREAHQSTEARYDRLVERLEVAEQQFTTLAHESLSKADETKTKVLIALGEVEQKLRQDADAVAENAVQTVRSESKMYMTQFLDTISSLERRLDDLEHENDHIHVQIPTITSSMTPRHSAHDTTRAVDMDQITEAVTKTLEQQLSGMMMAMRSDVAQHSALETKMRHHIETLEDRLEKNALRAEEQSAILSGRYSKTHESARHRKSSSSSSGTPPKPIKRVSTRTPTTTTPPRRTVPKRKTIQETSTSKAKTDRLKELCLDLVAMEGSLKSKRRTAEKS